MAPQPGETVRDPGCGTGGFLLAVHDCVVRYSSRLTGGKCKAFEYVTLKGWELVRATVPLHAMGLLRHCIGT